MKRITFIILAVAALLSGSVSCQKVNDIDKRLTELEQTVSDLKAQIVAGAVITSVDKTADGCTFTLSNGQTYNVTNGKNGTDGEAIIADVKIEENFVVLTLKNGETLSISYQNPLSIVTLNIVPNYTDGTVRKPVTTQFIGEKSTQFTLDIAVTPANYAEALSDTSRFIHKAVLSRVQTKVGFGNAFTLSPKSVLYAEGAPIPFLQAFFEINEETAALLLNDNTPYTISYSIEDKDGVHGVSTAFVNISHEKGSGGDVTDNSTTPAGALPGVFSVSATKKVYFSKGNLKYTREDNVWGFFDKQYECDPGNSITYDPNYISLFSWGYGDWSTDPDTEDYQKGGAFTDWGKALDDKGTWRTLSTEEWEYLFSFGNHTNATRTGLFRYVKSVMGKIDCIVLYPDGYSGSKDEDFTTVESVDAASNAGIVFLPAAGSRDSSILYDVGVYGFYWSSSQDGVNSCFLAFDLDGIRFSSWSGEDGFSVRLVTDCH